MEEYYPIHGTLDRLHQPREYLILLTKPHRAHNVGAVQASTVIRLEAANKNPFFNKSKNKLALVAMAVQEPTLTYRNPNTGKPFSKDEFMQFAEHYLGADIIFWSTRSPWLAKK